ncbi:spore germination protein [Paenibacillus sp. MBLB4367]|uniref:spore germination protein n=1 Tax=Paenibacillus sp. MBLB4367 TaxID=3384767 RepID=UPI00390804EE
MRSFLHKLLGKPAASANPSTSPNRPHAAASRPLSRTLAENIAYIRENLGRSGDLTVREFQASPVREVRAALIYMEGLADKDTILVLLESLLMRVAGGLEPQLGGENDIEAILGQLPITSVSYRTDINAILDALLSGNTVFLLDGSLEAAAIGTRGGERRSVSEPTAQSVVRGPQEGFTEDIQTNVAMVRRKIKDSKLWMETRTIGRVTKTAVTIMHIEGIAKADLLNELRARLDRIDIDGILESNYIEELIQDSTFSVFPTVNNTERPDVAAAALLEGRVAIFVDGTPFVLLVPALFTQFLQAPEDYYHRSDFGLLRLLRYVALLISLLAPSLYIALTTYHQEMLPTTLLISLAAQREGIPFPAFIEALIMEVTFELLREAGIRMPKAIGPAISIVGALVLGQASVEAGLVSPAMVIVVSITAIAGFIFPSFELGISIRMLRFAFMVIAASFGFFGIIVGMILLVLHMCHLESFGTPFLAPIAPMRLSDQKDTIVRLPWRYMYTRPKIVQENNETRQSGASAGPREDPQA